MATAVFVIHRRSAFKKIKKKTVPFHSTHESRNSVFTSFEDDITLSLCP